MAGAVLAPEDEAPRKTAPMRRRPSIVVENVLPLHASGYKTKTAIWIAVALTILFISAMRVWRCASVALVQAIQSERGRWPSGKLVDFKQPFDLFCKSNRLSGARKNGSPS